MMNRGQNPNIKKLIIDSTATRSSEGSWSGSNSPISAIIIKSTKNLHIMCLSSSMPHILGAHFAYSGLLIVSMTMVASVLLRPWASYSSTISDRSPSGKFSISLPS